MKKSLLALAVLGAFAGAASAQSSVILYGRVDLSLARNLGSSDLVMQNGSGSRFGVRGTEDLGGGLKALFQIEHRFNADEGTAGPADRFWHGRSIVGLTGGFGTVHFGRDYTPAFLMSELRADPWGWDTVAANSRITGGLISPVRHSNSITYNWSGGGLGVGAQVALKEAGDDNGFSLGVNYAAGPLFVSASYVKPVNTSGTNWMTLAGSYNLGAVKLGAFFGNGKSAATSGKHRSWMATAVAPMGAGELRFSYGQLKHSGSDGAASLGTITRQIGLGYHYNMSKRTTLYVDVVNDGKRVASNKTGVDLGIKHNF